MSYGNILCDLTLLITVVVCGYGRKHSGCELWLQFVVRIERHFVISKINCRTIVVSCQNFYTESEELEVCLW